MSGHDWPCQMDTWKLTITSLLKMKALVPQLLVGWGADSSQLSPSPGTALSLRELPCPRSHLALLAQGMLRYKDQPPLRQVGTILKGHPWYWAPHGIRWSVCCNCLIPAPLLFLLFFSLTKKVNGHKRHEKVPCHVPKIRRTRYRVTSTTNSVTCGR